MQKKKKCSEKYRFSEFLMRLNLGANGFRGEIFVLANVGVQWYGRAREQK